MAGMINAVAKAIATANGDDYDKIPYGKSEWTAQRGGEPFRDINQPFRADYDATARHNGDRLVESPTDRLANAKSPATSSAAGQV